jgi:hypothetical protein
VTIAQSVPVEQTGSTERNRESRLQRFHVLDEIAFFLICQSRACAMAFAVNCFLVFESDEMRIDAFSRSGVDTFPNGYDLCGSRRASLHVVLSLFRVAYSDARQVCW